MESFRNACNRFVSKPKGRFFWFVYAKGIPKEPSLWFENRSPSAKNQTQ